MLLDADVAEIHGVATRDINKAVANNRDKFPEGYVVELTRREKEKLVETFHRFDRLKHSTVSPKAFPEKGLYMLATILKSPQAVRATLAIIEMFARMRELTRDIRTLAATKDKGAQDGLMRKSGEIIAEILNEPNLPDDVVLGLALALRSAVCSLQSAATSVAVCSTACRILRAICSACGPGETTDWRPETGDGRRLQSAI